MSPVQGDATYLIFSTFNVGGFNNIIASLLHDQGVPVILVNTGHGKEHDSAVFHYGDIQKPYDLSHLFNDAASEQDYIDRLHWIKNKYKVKYCLATGFKAWLLRVSGIKYNYWAFGSDLDEYAVMPPYFNTSETDVLTYCIKNYFNLGWKSMFIDMNMTLNFCEKIAYAPYQKHIVDRIIPEKKFFYFPHMIEAPEWSDVAQLKKEKIDKLAGKRYVVSTTRQVWTGELRLCPSNKRNDILLQGFSTYVTNTNDEETVLALFNKGDSLEASKALAEEIGIASRIVWLDEVPRAQLAPIYAGAVAALGQFGVPIASFSVLEPLAYATPSISHCLPVHSSPEIFPVLNCPTPDTIASALQQVIGDPAYAADLGRRSWEWVKEYCSFQKVYDAIMASFSDE